MKNIHKIPTDKPSKLLYNHTLKSFCFQKKENGMFVNDGKVSGASFWSIEKAQHNGFCPQHIYITSDEEIKEGDWVIKVITLYKGGGSVEKYSFIDKLFEDITFKKIILTTDKDLIKDGVQPIDDEFLEWFVKNPSCEFADVNDWLDDNGNIAFGGNTRYQLCNHLYNKESIPKEEPKQELEEETWELAKKLFKEKCEYEPNLSNSQDLLVVSSIQEGIIKGAKWQQEQDKNKYSEEEAFNLCREFAIFVQHNGPSYKKQQEWFEQYKKK